MPGLPTGTVTFLFTDIEGSTRLWEAHPEAMREAVTCHDALATSIIPRHNGTLVKSRGEGDSLFAAFPSAAAGVAAACDLQLSLSGTTWPPEITVRVRMALHTGEADLRDGDYYGGPVNRCARLRAIAHGGQTLLSQATYELAQDSLPPHVTVKDLGLHRLKDLREPEQVYQVVHPDLAAEFPPLRSLSAIPNNLPQQLTRFIGREKEVAEVKRLLEKTRLLTLTGSGGSGKTRLALHVAADLLEVYKEGLWLIELAPLADPALVPQAVASALGITEDPGRPIQQKLAEELKSRSALLLLDNCEHVLAACARLADSLLRSCPNVHILASSRESLSIAGELTYRVPSMLVPDPRRLPAGGARLVSALSQYDAVKLFLDRAILSLPGFELTVENAPLIAQICHRLDGIPMAIELAAARVKAMPIEQIASRLDDRFRLLTGGSRTALPRQQTLRALIDWSYDLLNAQERALLRRLSVFAGGWTLEATEAVCAGVLSTNGGEEGDFEDWEVLDLLTQLVDKSLVVYDEIDGVSRYRQLQTLRQYGQDRLKESGEIEEMHARHLAYYLQFTEEAVGKLGGADQAVWLARLETEHDNLRAALHWCKSAAGHGKSGLQMAVRLSRFWDAHGHIREGREHLADLLALEETAERTAERAKALNGAGNLAHSQGDLAAARAFLEESLAIWRELGDASGIARALLNLGNIEYLRGEYEAARTLYSDYLKSRREKGDPQGIANGLTNLGMIARKQADYAGARALYEESLAILRKLGNKQGIANALNNLGTVARDLVEFATSREFYEESLEIARSLENGPLIASVLNNLGLVVHAQGDPSARDLLEEGLRIRQDRQIDWAVASSLNNLAILATDEGRLAEAQALMEESLKYRLKSADKESLAFGLESYAGLEAAQAQEVPGAEAQAHARRAARLFGAADALRAEIGVALSPWERQQADRQAAAVCALMGDKAFAAARAEGRTLTPEEACAQEPDESPT